MSAEMLAELYEDDVAVPAEGGPESWELTQVRNVLIRLRQLEREQEQVAKTRAAVVDAYKARENAIEANISDLRMILQSVLERGPHGDKITFPDAGTIHLTTKGGNLVLKSQEEAVSAYGKQFTRPTVDMTALSQWARKAFTEDGEIPKGFDVAPKYKTLVVKKP